MMNYIKQGGCPVPGISGQYDNVGLANLIAALFLQLYCNLAGQTVLFTCNSCGINM